MSTQCVIETPHGEARLVTDHPHDAQHGFAAEPLGTLLLSHGAGNGIDTADLTALATHLPANGFEVVRLEQPWKRAGRKVATPPPTLDAALTAAARHLQREVPLVVGGRSAGARSAARCAAHLHAAGCLALAFPLHPPGRPEKSRLPELLAVGVPTLLVQGERDTMGRPEEFPEDLPGHVDLTVVPDADHGFHVRKSGSATPELAMEVVVEAVLEWLVREIIGD
ncbi:alpha/beta family hydrolase [Nocardioides ferulae]|uniref:alpha/beta hydrolase family protein n=1 Tax=Nocardioides ferulae TaxID=2340821 RepID=UPI000EB5D73C|nr:alpha/beta family hydrolase [Nocardioides ferulae]